MTSDLDIYRSAQVLVKRHGQDALIEAAMRADAMLEKSDLDGYAVWKGKPAHNMYIAAISSHLESG